MIDYCPARTEEELHPAQFAETWWVVYVRDGASFRELTAFADRIEIEDGIARFYLKGRIAFVCKDFAWLGVKDPEQHEVSDGTAVWFVDDSSKSPTARPGGVEHKPFSRFEKFSEQARRVLSLAKGNAEGFNHNYVGTEHVLLGLISETNGVAYRILSNMGVDTSKIRSAVEFIIGRGDRPAQGEIGMTPRANKMVELAVDEARRMNQNWIGTEHLLIGLLCEGNGVAASVLECMGVTVGKVRIANNGRVIE